MILLTQSKARYIEDILKIEIHLHTHSFCLVSAFLRANTPLIYVYWVFKLIIVLMWTELLNESRSQRKFDNKPLIILGNRHSGKRSLVDSLFDISKTTLYSKRLAPNAENKMRLHGTTTAIDYAYLNVVDMHDPDNRIINNIKAPTRNWKCTWSNKSITRQSTANWPSPNSLKTASSLSC